MNRHLGKIKTEIGLVELMHPSIDDLPYLIAMLKTEDLDLRRLVLTSKDSYISQGDDAINKEWESLLSRIKISFLPDIYDAIQIQSKGILSNPIFPAKNKIIEDPFNLTLVENEKIDNLLKSQLKNIIIAKHNSKIVCAGRD